LLLWGQHKERHALYKILRATGAEVRFLEPSEQTDALDLDPASTLVILDYDSLRADANVLLDRIGRRCHPPPVLVMTATRDKRDLISLFSHQVLTNLVAKNTDIKATELVVTVQKIMHNDVFGFEKYLAWGAAPLEHVVRSSTEKESILEAVECYLSSLGCNRRLVGLAGGVADEFLMNAVYNAPVDGEGRPKYAARSRADRVDLEPGEEVVFRYVYDGRVLAISVSDNFGRLEGSTVLTYLRKCFVQGADQVDAKEGGAGLGLYYIFESLNQLVINVAPQRRTEMIGLMDVSGSYRDFAEQPKSLNIFIEEPRA
jgi:hypothetical protein